MRLLRRTSLPLAALTLIALASCTDTTTNPTVGSGDLLEATVNGSKVSFDLQNLAGLNTYTVSTQDVRIGGSIGSPTRTMTIHFTYNLDTGTFPHTFSDDQISINYAEVTGTGTVTYDCPIGGGTCSVTITGSNGHIVDGTFHATLSDVSDPSKTVTITDGTFSAQLTRQ